MLLRQQAGTVHELFKIIRHAGKKQDASMSGDAHFISRGRPPILYSSKVPHTSLMSIPLVTKRSLALAANRFLASSEMTKSKARLMASVSVLALNTRWARLIFAASKRKCFRDWTLPFAIRLFSFPKYHAWRSPEKQQVQRQLCLQRSRLG